MLGIVEKIKNVFSGDFVREVIRREKSAQEHEETKNEAESEEQTLSSEGSGCN